MSTQPLPQLYLASKSPRRRALLEQIGVHHQVLLLREAAPRGPDVSELLLPNELAHDYVARVTQEKADMAWQVMQWRNLAHLPILAADTSVLLGQQVLGKPANRAQAIAMLSQLAGTTHQVLTCIALRTADGMHTASQCSEVSFAELSAATIAAYCDSAEPYDKAGGYGIQGGAARFISHINGSYSGIMGLPLFETCQLLRASHILTS